MKISNINLDKNDPKLIWIQDDSHMKIAIGHLFINRYSWVVEYGATRERAHRNKKWIGTMTETLSVAKRPSRTLISLLILFFLVKAVIKIPQMVSPASERRPCEMMFQVTCAYLVRRYVRVCARVRARRFVYCQNTYSFIWIRGPCTVFVVAHITPLPFM